MHHARVEEFHKEAGYVAIYFSKNERRERKILNDQLVDMSVCY